MSPRVAVVTGANKGIGLAIAAALAQQYTSSALNTGSSLLIYVTARSPERGASAVSSLESDPSLSSILSPSASGPGKVSLTFHPLDVTQPPSITALATHLKATHPDGIDVLVNNAGVAFDGFSPALVRDTLDANYFGTQRVTEALLPLLRPASTSRVVNVASMMGRLNGYPSALASRFREARARAGAADALMREFQEVVEDEFKGSKGAIDQAGYPSSAYRVSKAGVIAYTGAVAARERARGSPVLVNCCCPGYVNTEMSKGRGPLSTAQGARVPVLLALGELHGVSGEFWQKGGVVEW